MLLRHFPFPEKFDLKMGTSTLPSGNSIIEIDDHYQQEIKLKEELLSQRHDYYYQSTASSLPAQWEVLELILNDLVAYFPNSFLLTKDDTLWRWENKKLNESISFCFGDADTLPMEPLNWVGRQVQEDLIILDTQLHLAAGQLCFPSGWCLNEKFEKHFMTIHAPLPKVTLPMIEAAGKLIERLPQQKSIQRNNWGFRVTDQLDLSSRYSQEYRQMLQRTAENINDHAFEETIFIRIEHQTLTRLLPSGYVLFTIHTYNNRLGDEIRDAERLRSLKSFLYGVPPDLLEYKLMTPFYYPLMDFLERKTTGG